MTDDRRVAVLLAVAWGLIATIAAYAAMRIGQRIASPAADPAVVGWSIHAGFFWRAWTCAFAGGFAAFAVFAVVTSHASHGAERRLRAARALVAGIAVSAALLLVQAIWFP